MQQVESVLEFLLDGSVYCFNTQLVEYVFDLEEYEPFEGLDEVVIGIVKYNNDTMLLIDTLFLYNNEKKINLSDNKSVIVIADENGGLYGMVVDEILKIEDVEVAPISLGLSNEEIIINHYKEKDRLVNEIVPLTLLKAKQIPAFKKKNITTIDKKDKLQTTEFLLFTIDKKLYALESEYVKEVVEKEQEIFLLDRKTIRFQGAISIRDEVVKVANIQTSNTTNELVVIKHKDATFCICVEEVLGIESFTTAKIEQLQNSANFIKAFYNLNHKVVGIIDVFYFLAKRVVQEEEKKKIQAVIEEKKSFLVFVLEEKYFAIDMQYVRQVFQTNEIAHNTATISTSSSCVEFIAEWERHAIEIISIDSLLFQNKALNEKLEIIVVEYENNLRGFLVDMLDDIIYVKTSQIAYSQQDSILLGTILLEQKVLPIINPNQIIKMR